MSTSSNTFLMDPTGQQKLHSCLVGYNKIWKKGKIELWGLRLVQVKKAKVLGKICVFYGKRCIERREKEKRMPRAGKLKKWRERIGEIRRKRKKIEACLEAFFSWLHFAIWRRIVIWESFFSFLFLFSNIFMISKSFVYGCCISWRFLPMIGKMHE